jgi:hypothetical protein
MFIATSAFLIIVFPLMGASDAYIALLTELAVVANYIEAQEHLHRKRAFHEEFIELLVNYGVANDPSLVFG